MPCPWYQYGICTSPKLSEPTDVVIAVDRCNSGDIYVNCMYYVAETQKIGFKRTQSVKKDKVKVYTPIHAIPPHIECQCPSYETINISENSIRLAYCKILDRYLTKYEAYQCSRYWKDCPYKYQPVE